MWNDVKYVKGELCKLDLYPKCPLMCLCFVSACVRCTAGYAEPHHKPTAGAGSRYADRAVLR